MSQGQLPRRRFLRLGAAVALLPAAIERALALPALGSTGTLADVEHVVILTQENRSFDHYFGTLRGVRGFGDRVPVPLPGGRPVWQQRTAEGRTILPYRLDGRRTRAQRVDGTPHTWPDAQQAWNDGRMDQWLPAKTERTMGHYTRRELDFQFALAEAFTLCDAYHCSFHGGTHPNRLFLWTGHNDPQGRGGGPALLNEFDDLGPADQGYAWTTYPERLQQAGIRWQHYQDMADNYTDNPVEGFRQYRAAAPGSALHARALTTRPLGAFAEDVRAGRLPQVSWLIAPAHQCEHPGPSSPLQGAEYTAAVLDALTARPEVWGRTVLFVNFDENDGFFDHVPPPAPPARGPDGRLLGGSTVALDGEYHDARRGPTHGTAGDPPEFHGRAYGLGPRVPMTVVSPWSRGGWVDSRVYDHTSVLRFLERRFGVAEPQISPWRRAVCGDLTGAFDFGRPQRRALPAWPATRGADAAIARAARLPPPRPPRQGALPRQEPGLRPSRALPYAVDVVQDWAADGAQLRLVFANAGQAAVVLQVYDRLDGAAAPRRYTIEPGRQWADTWRLREGEGAAYDLQVHGPNGLLRAYRGSRHLHGVAVTTRGDASGRLGWAIEGGAGSRLTLRDGYGRRVAREVLLTGHVQWQDDLAAQHHWYDFELRCADDPLFLRRAAGRIETGRDGVSDIGLAAPAATRRGT